MKALSIIGIILALLDLSVCFRFAAKLIFMLHLHLSNGLALFQLSTPIYLLAISIVVLVKVGREKK